MAISFRAEVANQVNQSSETKANAKCSASRAVVDDLDEDILDISTDNDVKTEVEAPKKKSAWQNFKNGYTNFRKGLITAGQYVVGAVKGLIYGSAAALAVVGADGIRGIINKSPKYISTKGKIAAGVVGVAVLISNLFKANLNANAKKAELDHRWQTGHNV